MSKIIGLLILISISLIFNSCSPSYIFKASLVQGRILLARESIADILSGETKLEGTPLSEEARDKLKLILEAREFARQHGLEPNKSYLSYSHIEDLPPIYVVSAAEQLSLRSVTWWYPFVGSIPYKGFFSLEEAEDEARAISSSKNDVSIRKSTAFSTLGWFNDPVLPSLLNGKKEYLVNTVIHEITHGTMWKQNEVSFNETSANAIGLIGATNFYKKTELEETASKLLSLECLIALDYINTFNNLNAIFSNNSISDDEKLKLKTEAYKLLEENIKKRYVSTFGPASLPNFEKSLNNSSFLATYIYLDKFPKFAKLYLFNTNLSDLIKQINQISKKDNPYLELSNLIIKQDLKISDEEACIQLKTIQ